MSSKVDTPPSEGEAPWLLQQWAWLYNAVPKICIPFSTFDISITLLSACFLYCVRRLGQVILVSQGWPADQEVTILGAASIAAIVHSTTLVPGLWFALRSQPYIPSSKMSEHPEWWQHAVTALLQFCTGYMIYDGLMNIIVLKWTNGMTASDWMFFGHHCATAFYMTSARMLGAGHISALICMFLGEATNPVHNSFMISELALTLDHYNGESWLYFAIEVTFCVLYLFFRVILGPIGMLYITFDLVFTNKGRQNVPVALKVLWLLMIWGVVLGSIPWIQDCITTLQQHMHSTKNDTEL